MASYEPIVSSDFNPHIEWYEFPMEIWDPYYPHTREERIAGREAIYTQTYDELADRYGLRAQTPFKISSVMGFILTAFYPVYIIWSFYRTWGLEHCYGDMVAIMEAEGTVVKIEDDELFLDNWMGTCQRMFYYQHDFLIGWKPPVKEGGAETSWKIPFEPKDVSEFKHLLSKN